ncbi:hypothetical protein D3C84_1040750 [compost metagenome]
MLTGAKVRMRAPATYSGILGPGTFEMATLANAGAFSVRRVRVTKLTIIGNSHGKPIDGKSVRAKSLNTALSCLNAWEDS